MKAYSYSKRLPKLRQSHASPQKYSVSTIIAMALCAVPFLFVLFVILMQALSSLCNRK